MSLAKKMGDAHEKHLSEIYGGRMTPGSGNQWNRPTDGRQEHYDDVMAFARDGKSTRAASMSIKLEDLRKLQDQSSPERPMLPIRFYHDDRLRSFEDWVLVTEDDMLELLERSRRLSEIERVETAWMRTRETYIKSGVVEHPELIVDRAWKDLHGLNEKVVALSIAEGLTPEAAWKKALQHPVDWDLFEYYRILDG